MRLASRGEPVAVPVRVVNTPALVPPQTETRVLRAVRQGGQGRLQHRAEHKQHNAQTPALGVSVEERARL